MRVWLDELVWRGDYTPEEIAAQEDPVRQCSWAPDPANLYGPLTTVAMSAGKVIGGVELWHNYRDAFSFLEMLIRDQAPEFKGVGADLVRAAVSWWIANYASFGYELRVHSMVRETGAVGWWTRYMSRPSDFTDAFIRHGDFYFPAVGWIIYPPRAHASAPSTP